MVPFGDLAFEGLRDDYLVILSHEFVRLVRVSESFLSVQVLFSLVG